jgi:hypothetical protein
VANKQWNLRHDCAVIAGYGKRDIVQCFILSKIVGIEITTDPETHTTPIRYKILLEGGHEIEIEDPDEIAQLREIFVEDTEKQGGHIHYI